MDPGVRRDDDLRVCSQPSLPLFQPTGKDRKPVRLPLCHPDESQDPAAFVVLRLRIAMDQVTQGSQPAPT